MIQLKDLCLSFGGQQVLQNCSLQVSQGRHIALMVPPAVERPPSSTSSPVCCSLTAATCR